MMAKPMVPDDLWMQIEPLLPEHRPQPKGGRPPCDDRDCLEGILFVLKTGIAWEDLLASAAGLARRRRVGRPA